jgi:hypothetical protein
VIVRAAFGILCGSCPRKTSSLAETVQRGRRVGRSGTSSIAIKEKTVRNHFLLVSAAVLLAATPLAQATAVRPQPGMWESTVTTEMQSGPSFMRHPHTSTFKKCMTKKDLNFKPPTNQKMHCTYKQHPLSAHKIHWDVSCTNSGASSTGHGVATVYRTHNKGYLDMVVHTKSMGMTMKMRETFSNRRVGACK